MKKYIQFFSVLIVFALLVIAKQSLSADSGNAINLGISEDDNHRVVAPSTTPTPTSVAKASATATPTPTSVPKPSATATPRGQYKDGNYTGSVADAYYGNVQVQAVISGGKITDVKFLQYPNDNHTSIRINSQAMPYLTTEAIQAQSAKVNTVSGASATSGAFVQSLTVALSQAI